MRYWRDRDRVLTEDEIANKGCPYDPYDKYDKKSRLGVQSSRKTGVFPVIVARDTSGRDAWRSGSLGVLV